MVDFSPKRKHLEEEDGDDLEEILDSAPVAPQKEQTQLETPDADLLEIIEKYEGRLAEPAETITYEQTEERLYASGTEMTAAYTYENGDEKSAYVEPDTNASIIAETEAREEWFRVNDPEDFEHEDPTFKSPTTQQYLQKQPLLQQQLTLQ
ncbi:MAG: hypothetical protein Q7S65_00790 [Nanoarchaeota archaeon]|nr:hypothetical protein [Nanoarchaeota archaeon]